ncbi:MAG: xylulokinase [Planctomycetes bacterium]|nr:xylulokinase [Planctomycetota bacterium]
MSLVVGLDVGTQGTKGLVLDVARGAVLARASASYGLIEGLPAGAAEQDPRTWRDAVRAVLGELGRGVDLTRVAALGVSGQQHGCVLLDEAGEPVRAAKLWCDTATADEAAELSARLGRNVATGFTASKVIWTQRHEPAAWARTARVLLPHDYVNRLLTGVDAMESGDASGTGWFDVRARRFDDEAVAAIDALGGAGGLAERLPALADPTAPFAPLGRVSADASRELGLPEGALVSSGGGDNMMSALGSGATRAGRLVVSLGTSGTAFAHADAPVVDPADLVASFCSSHGAWLPLLCVMNLTGVTEEVRAGFGRSHAELTAAARDVPAGCEGLLWLPYLAGERVPDLPRARGALVGMRAGHLRPGVLYRAALEGTSLNLAWGVERLRALGVAADEVRLVGGAAKNALWREVLADCLGAPVTPLGEAESAALGAALQALACTRHVAGEPVDLEAQAAPFLERGPTVAPTDEGAAVYAELGARFRDAVERGVRVDEV